MKSPEFYHFVAASALAATACAQEPQQLKDVQYNLHFDGFRVPCEQVLQQATLEKGYCVGESPRKEIAVNPHRMINARTREDVLAVLNCVYAPLQKVKFSTEESYYNVHNVYVGGVARNISEINGNSRTLLMGSTVSYHDRPDLFDHIFVVDSVPNDRNRLVALRSYEMAHTVTHEIGHSLGLQHSEVPGLMHGKRDTVSYAGHSSFHDTHSLVHWNFSPAEAQQLLIKVGTPVTIEAVSALTQTETRCADILEPVRNRK